MVARITSLLVLVAILVSGSWLMAQQRQSQNEERRTGDAQQAGGKQAGGKQAGTGQSGTDLAGGNSSRPGDDAAQPQKVIRSEREWRQLLTREQYKVLRQKGTERPYRNKYDKHFEPGTYVCGACGYELFPSTTKFDSGCGWPAFYATKAGNRVILKPDFSLGMARVEVICARCESHLGHVFRDAPQTPTGNRFCINSVSLKFIPAQRQGNEDGATQSNENRASR